MTALLSKKLTSDKKEIKNFEVFLLHNYPKLMESYYEWEELTSINDESLNLENLHKIFQ